MDKPLHHRHKGRPLLYASASQRLMRIVALAGQSPGAHAGLAQMVEQLFCKHQVTSSILVAGTSASSVSVR